MTRKHFLVPIILLLAACAPAPNPDPGPAGSPDPITPPPPTSPTLTPTPFQPLPNTPSPITPPSPTRTPNSNAALSLWSPPALAPFLSLDGTPLTLTDDPAAAALRLGVNPDAPLTRWVYALVAPFPTVTDGVTLAEVQAAWNGEGPRLWVSAETWEVFSAWWGAPRPGSGEENVRLAPPDRLLENAWDQRPAWAIIPFEAIEPRWKVLAVDGQSPLRKDFELEAYPLAVPFGLLGDADLAAAVAGLYPEMLPPANRDPAKLTTVAITGVTALVRATAWTMEQRGITYPAQDIGDWLREADITHISNEVPFARDCPPPNPVQVGVIFCSDPRYIELLEAVGTDVVELSGDHFADWGPQAMLYTLELYRERGWPYYGGGENYADGRQAALFEHNGNKIAFIGCNGKRGVFAQAGPDNPGAVACDIEWVAAETARLRQAGYLVIATFQHFEYYSYAFPAESKPDFWAVADAGAVVVSGSQAHQPHGFEFRGDSLIHYGLGNLFFDQLDVSPATVQGFIDRHVFYDGRYLGVELLTIQFVDYARPRPMTPAEREALLRAVFAASGW